MELITLGIVLLLVAVVIALTQKLFWLFSLIVFYRAVGALLPFEVVQAQIGVESHFLYFLVVVVISVVLHYFVVVRLLSEFSFLLLPLFIGLMIWILYSYDLLEIIFLKDWLVTNDLWGTENIQQAIKDLFSMDVDETKTYFADGFTAISETLWNVIYWMRDGALSLFEFVKTIFTEEGAA